MVDEELLNQIFLKKQEKVEEKINKEYHRRIKEINVEDMEEKNNIKLGIISELYYKEGFKDGVELMLK